MKLNRRGFLKALGIGAIAAPLAAIAAAEAAEAPAAAAALPCIPLAPARSGIGSIISPEDVDDDLYGIIHRVLPRRAGSLARAYAANDEGLEAAFGRRYFST